MRDERDALAAELACARAERDRVRDVLDRVFTMAPASLWTYSRKARAIEYLRGDERLLGGRSHSHSAVDEEIRTHEIHADDRARVSRQTALGFEADDGEVIVWEARQRHRDGSWRTLHTSVTPLARDADGSVSLLLGATLDLSERRRLEAERHAVARESVLAGERERHWLASAVHDGLGQLLPLLRTKLALLRERSGSKASDPSWLEIDQLVVDAHREAVALVHRLSPTPLGELGLSASLQWLAEDFEHRRGLRVVLSDRSDAAPLSPALEIALIRITRGLLDNFASHAGVREARIALRRSRGALRIEISGARAGFDVEAAFARGRDLERAREGLAFLGGSLRVASKAGAGTRITLLAPLALGEKLAGAGDRGGA